jgi:hypothetical protein
MRTTNAEAIDRRAIDSSLPGGPIWTPQYDLIASGAEDRYFVVEVENDRTARLRFGDGLLGRA